MKVGDEVRVFDVNGRRFGQPEGGYVGTVTKVGRKLVYVDYRERYGPPQAFRLEDGVANDAYGHQSILTLEEVAERNRWRIATDVLAARGLRFEHRRGVTLEDVEKIADILRRDSSEGGEN